MNTETPQTGGEAFSALLVAYDKALAAGERLGQPPKPELPAGVTSALARDLDCVQLLRRVLPQVEPASPGAELPADVQLGRFRIRRQIGRGAFGLVFLAHDPHLGREVALKVPRLGTLVTPELRERFMREARAAAVLDHPNLVPVYDAGQEGPVCYIASAYCPGVTLADWLRQRTEPLPANEAAALVGTLAAAVQYAHERGVIHRDLKPGNILLSFSREPVASAGGALATGSRLNEATPRITDFGLAKQPGAGGEDQTDTGAIVGTPAYMAPEQAGGNSKHVGAAADTYALGVILYELLTGRPPFRGDTPLETLEQVRSLEPVPPRRLRPRLPRDLETVCLKCLEKDPARRYGRAGDLAEDLGRFQSGEPIRARSVGWIERGWRWCRRRPALVGLTAVLVVVLAGGVLGVLGQWRRAERHRQREIASARQAREAVYQSYLLISESLSHEPGFQPLRKKMLESALRFYETFVREREQDPDSADDLATAYLHQSLILSETCCGGEALQMAEKCHALRTRLAQARPEDGEAQRKLAESWLELGAAQLQVQQAGAAAASWTEALRICTKLLEARPADPILLSYQARTHYHLAMSKFGVGQFAEALSGLQAAVALQEQLVGAQPELYRERAYLADMYLSLGNALQDVAGQADARRSFERGRDLMETVVAEFPGNNRFQMNLYKHRHNLAHVLRTSGQPALAARAFEAAQEVIATLADANPAVVEFRFLRSQCLMNLGNAYLDLSQLDKARTAYEQALAIQNKSPAELAHHPDFQGLQTLTLVNLGALHFKAGEGEQALTCFRRSAESLEKQCAAAPGDLAPRENLAIAYSNMGETLALMKQYAPAKEMYGKALQTRAPLLEAHPEVLRLAVGQADVIISLADLSLREGHVADALRGYDKAIGMLEPVLARDKDFDLAKTTLQQAQVKRAEAARSR
jgi:tetratricopeptide (TPR) repeat protein